MEEKFYNKERGCNCNVQCRHFSERKCILLADHTQEVTEVELVDLFERRDYELVDINF